MANADPLYNDWIQQQLRVQPDNLALYDLTADRPFTGELNARIDALAHRLSAENVEQAIEWHTCMSARRSGDFLRHHSHRRRLRPAQL